MASARARLGASRRGVRRKQERSETAAGIFDTIATVSSFVGGQVKKADTAWGEYEAGYKELGGEGFEKPKFGQKGYFKGPEGEVRIGEKMYDRGQIQKAGSFLGSDAAAGLSPEMRESYLGRTAPGRWDPSQFTKPAQGPSLTLQTPTQPGATPSVTADIGRETTAYTPYTGSPDYATTSQFPTKDYTQTVSRSPAHRISEKGGLMAGRQEPIQEIKDPKPRGRQFGQWFRDFARGLTPGKGLAVHTSGERAGEIITDEERYPGGYQPAFARGGDFITNGPQEILVGDNPGGRERVTIKPLSSEEVDFYNKNRKRNLLDSLYENNKNRKY